MQPDFKKESARWLEQAQKDFADAGFLKDNKRYNVACFLYQQSAEKAVKAFLYAQELEDVWGHSVAELCQEARKYNKGFSSLVKDAYLLDKFYIPTRYPNGLPGGIPSDAFTDKDALGAHAACAGIIEFVRENIK